MTTTFKDSGKRSEFATGAVRDTSEGKGRFDLLPADAIRQLACVMEIGDKKYPDGGGRNWEKGIPLYRYVDSAMRHLCCVMAGMTDEPHIAQVMWNIACLIQTEIWIRQGRLPDSLRERWPHPIRLIPTGDVEEFNRPIEEFAERCVTTQQTNKAEVAIGDVKWITRGVLWEWNCPCGGGGVQPAQIKNHECSKCGIVYFQPRHLPPAPSADFVDKVEYFWHYKCPCGMTGKVNECYSNHECSKCGQLHFMTHPTPEVAS